MPWVLGFLALTSFFAYGLIFASGAGATLARAAGADPIAKGAVDYAPQFRVPASAAEGQPVLPNIADPDALNAQTVCPGYKASDFVTNGYGFAATLTLAGEPCNIYGNDVDVLDLSVTYQNANRLSISISPARIDASNSSWFVLDEKVVPRPGVDADAKETAQSGDFQVVWSNDPSFSFTVVRKSTGEHVFDTSGSVLVFEDQFIEFVTSMPANYNVYGLGERIHGLRLGNNFTATIFAADVGDTIDKNLYGSHPVYLDTRYFDIDDGGNMTLVTDSETKAGAKYKSYSHGVYLRNAHGQEILMQDRNITWRTIGGSLDLYFYAGPSASDVIKQHQQVIGLPAMQQYFTLGYHQCRWGYQNWTVLQDVIDTFAKFEIPLENIWTDIDYMKQYRDFDMDPNTFPIEAGQRFLSKLHDNHQHYIPIVDSAIYIPNPRNASDAYDTYTRGDSLGAFLKNPDGSQYIGEVWPGYTVFPDWRAPRVIEWWVSEFERWYANITFDGIWIDMSEVSSFCTGSCGTNNRTLNPVSPPFLLPGEPGNINYDYPEGFNLTNATEAAAAASAAAAQAIAYPPAAASQITRPYLRTGPTPGRRNINYPPYVINNAQGELAAKTVSPNATHSDGVVEYDVHNLFGHQILAATYDALLRVYPTKRPFIIGRSTFAGSGKYAGHWGGDNYSKWAYMYFAIPQALSFGLFGFPMFGVDTCGFSGNADEELCNRWMQLSAFFPFYRNHNSLGQSSQEPYVWASVAEATKKAMKIRYRLLPYMYTLLQRAHAHGETVMRALAWEFPDDPSLASADRQFLLGPSILVAPVLVQGASSVNAVFPGSADGALWYDWYTSLPVSAAPGENKTIPAPLGHIPVFVRGGSVLPLQDAALTTWHARRSPWSLLIALDAVAAASGSLYLDDGESLLPNATLTVSFTAQKGALSVTALGSYVQAEKLSSVLILGVSSAPASVAFEATTLPPQNWAYNGERAVLNITGLDSVTGAGGAWARNWTLTWS